jgi:FlaA1/EpsC-like NDP-sugar epimerase
MTLRLPHRRKLWQLAADLALAALPTLLALTLRFKPEPIPAETWRICLACVLPLTLIRLLLFWRLRVYQIAWRYVGLRDLVALVKGVSLSSGIFGLGLAALGTGGYPRSVFALEWLLACILLGGLRLSLRTATLLRSGLRAQQDERRRLLILGAGDHAAALARAVGCHPHLNYRLIGFLDDDETKHGLLIHGAPVLGPIEAVEAVVRARAIQEVTIAIPSATGAQVRRILALCEGLPVRLRTTPGFGALPPAGVAHGTAVRDVALEDLLRRRPVRTDLASVAGYLQGERVLITGAGGSIGAELVRQVLGFGPRQVLLLGRGENSIFELEQGLASLAVPGARCQVPGGNEFSHAGASAVPTHAADALGRVPAEASDHREAARAAAGLSASSQPGAWHLAPGTAFVPLIGDVRDRERLEQIFDRYRPTVVFHAAAHKHVPLMEAHAEEAVKNNVLGTRHLLELAGAHRVKRFLLISTDKAVNPTSVMGATKRIAEMLLQAQAQATPETRFMAVRLGNVLGSRGSVVQRMRRQILGRQPVTVTHPEMVRYFMTIPEAVQLVIQAGALGGRGEIFVLDMGEPVRILDLARDLIRLSGFIPGEEIPIEITGIRPGEKLCEELLTAQEGTSSTQFERILMARPSTPDPARLHPQVEALIALARAGDGARVRQKMAEIVPEYQCPQRVVKAAGQPLAGTREDARCGAGSPSGAAPSAPRAVPAAPSAASAGSRRSKRERRRVGCRIRAMSAGQTCD